MRSGGNPWLAAASRLVSTAASTWHDDRTGPGLKKEIARPGARVGHRATQRPPRPTRGRPRTCAASASDASPCSPMENQVCLTGSMAGGRALAWRLASRVKRRRPSRRAIQRTDPGHTVPMGYSRRQASTRYRAWRPKALRPARCPTTPARSQVTLYQPLAPNSTGHKPGPAGHAVGRTLMHRRGRPVHEQLAEDAHAERGVRVLRSRRAPSSAQRAGQPRGKVGQARHRTRADPRTGLGVARTVMAFVT